MRRGSTALGGGDTRKVADTSGGAAAAGGWPAGLRWDAAARVGRCRARGRGRTRPGRTPDGRGAAHLPETSSCSSGGGPHGEAHLAHGRAASRVCRARLLAVPTAPGTGAPAGSAERCEASPTVRQQRPRLQQPAQPRGARRASDAGRPPGTPSAVTRGRGTAAGTGGLRRETVECRSRDESGARGRVAHAQQQRLQAVGHARRRRGAQGGEQAALLVDGIPAVCADDHVPIPRRQRRPREPAIDVGADLVAEVSGHHAPARAAGRSRLGRGMP
jgi:hypothetical protein